MQIAAAGTRIDWLHPSNWPFFIWIWLAFMLYGFVGAPLWKWWQKQRGESWPISFGTIDYGNVEEKSSRNGSWYEAQIYYDYTVDGQRYSRKYKRRVNDDDVAQELVRDLRARSISVHVNPRNAGKSYVSDSEIDRVAAERPPKVEEPVSFEPEMTRSSTLNIAILTPFALLSLAGFVVSLAVHIAGIMGKRIAPDWALFAMHVGIFIVFVPGILFMRSLGKKDWRRWLQPEDAWLKYTTYVLFGYTFLNFFYVTMTMPGKQTGAPSAQTWRAFSGHWMLFYFVSFGMHYVNAKYGGLSTTNVKQKTLKIFS